jgi:hypothetical protein
MNHTIIPPQWQMDAWQARIETMGADAPAILLEAAQWGADTELEGCCEWLSVPCPSYGRELRNARRPKPPSLKEQALAALNEIEDRHAGPTIQEELIRRALEQLDD